MLAKLFAAQLGKELRGREVSLTEDACAALLAHRWPGNVRELENAIERACILSDSMVLTPKDLGLDNETMRTTGAGSFDLSGTLAEAAQRAVREVERQKILNALELSNGNKMHAAENLAISYKTLLSKIKDYDL
jgi:DNA-binding NtrC family response regulator